jgi:hypothetical protein
MNSSMSDQSPGIEEVRGAPELIDRTELARRFNVDVRTVSRMVKRGELPYPCVGQGGRPRWLWAYVIEYCRKRHERQTVVDRRLRSKLR